jgi:hypothetical protein
VRLKLLDFRPTDQGYPSYIVDGSTSAYSLKDMLALPDAPIEINPGQTVNVPLELDTTGGQVPGVYYGSVVFSNTNQDSTTTSFSGVAGTIVLTVRGNLKTEAKLVKFDVVRLSKKSEVVEIGNIFGSPFNAVRLYVENTGDNQVVPFGKLLLRNMSGKVVGEYEISSQSDSVTVLPQSKRYIIVPLATSLKPGRYTAEVSMGYDKAGSYLHRSVSAWYIPTPYMVAALIVVIVCVVVVSRRSKHASQVAETESVES